MKHTNKKGFTIVELVIVIAVIAILAAVLIPNLSRLVEKANDSADMQEAKAAMDSDLILANGQYDKMYGSAAEIVTGTVEGEANTVRYKGWYDKTNNIYHYGNYQFNTTTGEWSKSTTTSGN